MQRLSGQAVKQAFQPLEPPVRQVRRPGCGKTRVEITEAIGVNNEPVLKRQAGRVRMAGQYLFDDACATPPRSTDENHLGHSSF